MTLWLELHCDLRTEGQHPKNILRPRCLTDENAGPREMADNNMTSIMRVVRTLADQGHKSGWVKTAGKWACPGCRGREDY